MKIRLVDADLLHTDGEAPRPMDGRTDTQKLIVAISNFAKVPNKTQRSCKARK